MFAQKTYAAQLKELYGCKRLGIRPSLPPVRKLLKALGNPHKQYKTVHIAGTNGKGSTTGAASRILQAAGYRVGSFYSPHVTDYRERIQVDNHMVAKAALSRTLREMGAVYEREKRKGADLPEKVTFFEWTTAAAFYHFAKAGVDVAVMETGMGGRFDATNVITPEASIITNISMEHATYLGGTKAAIAREKAGIIKRGKPVISGVPAGPAREAIEEIAQQRGCKTFFIGRDFTVGRSGLFTAVDGTQVKLEPAMPGRFQQINGALAAQAVLASRRLSVTPDDIAKGVRANVIPGRFQVSAQNGSHLIMDVAHNPDSTRELVTNLKKTFPGKTFKMVLGVLRGKDLPRMLKILKPVTREMLCITPDDFRAIMAEDLVRQAKATGIKARAAKSHDDITPFLATGGPWVVAGSFTTVDAASSRGNARAPKKATV